ncbi:F-box domain-containing protein [Mycena sanguinolenta]|uniref:F-box domain-containing protein n=1 Tax=Mycena sanguinolenta TaxID=230812 RepID=A0A8H7D4M2_9AGAR|nr:F-box domain-containing protein [Mycena sanguinolenta]
MSIEALQARITEISSEIALQEKLLQRLRHEKSLVQRELNEAVDPIARLPLEISSQIFLQCLAPFDEHKLGARHAPLLLLSICNSWSTIALSTPGLWSAIPIYISCPRGSTQLLQTWRRRAGNHPLSISLLGNFRNVTYCIPDIIWRLAGRLKRLAITQDEDGFGQCGCDPDGYSEIADLFGNAAPKPLPLLETLKVRGTTIAAGFRIGQILQLLRLAPNVVHCMFDGMALYHFHDLPSERLRLPLLRTLKYGSGSEPEDDDGILPRVGLPALTDLFVGVSGSCHELFGLIKHSTPPLRSLVVGKLGGLGALDAVELCDSLHLVPSLERLEMWFPCHVAEFFDNLADTPSLLPNLRTLIIHPRVILDSSWDSVVRALSGRHIELQIDHLYKKPPEEALVALGELVANGAEVHIRSDQCDYI